MFLVSVTKENKNTTYAMPNSVMAMSEIEYLPFENIIRQNNTTIKVKTNIAAITSVFAPISGPIAIASAFIPPAEALAPPSIAYVVFLFSFVTLTRNMEKGYLYIWLIFIGAWATDTFAYFTGVAIGKTASFPRSTNFWFM
jgi:CDP-diglyceride synthetase